MWSRDVNIFPFQQLVLHQVDLIVHRPSECVEKVLRNLASAIVDVAINLLLGILGFNESDSLCEVLGAIKVLPQVVDEISKLIVKGIVTELPPNHGMYLYCRMILVGWSLSGDSLLSIRFRSRRMGLWDLSGEATVLVVGVLWTIAECRVCDAAIRFGRFCRTLPIR